MTDRQTKKCTHDYFAPWVIDTLSISILDRLNFVQQPHNLQICNYRINNIAIF